MYETLVRINKNHVNLSRGQIRINFLHAYNVALWFIVYSLFKAFTGDGLPPLMTAPGVSWYLPYPRVNCKSHLNTNFYCYNPAY